MWEVESRVSRAEDLRSSEAGEPVPARQNRQRDATNGPMKTPSRSIGLGLLAALLFPLLASFARAAGPVPEVELLVDGDSLLPSTTLEVRFAREMVGRDHVGIPVANSPLVFQPSLPGKFTWLSRRSGVFVPSEPPKMGTAFKIGLRADLQDGAGQPFAPRFQAGLKTPPFQISFVATGVSPDAVAAMPEVKIAFNRDVKLDTAAKRIRFLDDAGNALAAEIRYALPSDYFQVKPEAEDWEKRWHLGRDAAPPAPIENDDDEADAPPGEPVRNRLLVKPAAPLASGRVWRLELPAGIEALTGGYQISQPRVIALGRVRPFALTSLVTSSYLNGGRSVQLEFPESLAPDVTTATAAKFFHLIPAVQNLRFEPDDHSVVLHGEFDRETEYRLDLDASLLAESGQAISGALSRTFRFAPVKPRVYLPEITGHQILGGRRKFPVQSVNLKSLRVIARLVPPDRAPQAVEAFAKYDKDFDEKTPDEKFAELPAGSIAGKIISDRVIELPAPALDAKQETTLDWDEILGPQKSGTIFLTIEGAPLDATGGKRPSAQALIQLTDLGVLWKKVAGQVRAQVFSMATGGPLAGVRVTILDEKFQRSAEAVTDAEGSAAVAPGDSPHWLTVRRGEDQHALRIGPSAQELPMAAFHLPIDYGGWEKQEENGPPLRALIFTDRPLYRSGETVHVKGIVRALGAAGLEADVGRDGTLTLFRPHDGGQSEIPIRTGEHGSFDADLPLESAATGQYSLRLKFAGRDREGWQPGFSATFQVADFQPNAFELSVAAAARFAPETPVAAEVSGKYFFGSVLAESRVRWTLQYSGERFAAADFDGFTFGDDEAPRQKTLTLRGEGKLTKAGTFAIRPQLPEPARGPSSGLFTVEVTDVNQQTVSESRRFERDSSSFYLGLKLPEEQVVGHAEEIVAKAVAIGPDGQPRPGPVAVKAELIRLRYETVRRQGAGNAISFHTDKIEEPVATAEGRTLVPVRAGNGWKLPAGETARFKPAKAGEYLLRVSARDEQGRESVAAFHFNVSGSEAISWDYRHPAQIDLVPDKMEYRAGETARILVKTPISGEAFVTIERGSRILRTQRVRLEGNAPSLEIPIEAGDAPNVFVSLVLLRGAEQSTRKFKVPEYRYGICQLHVGDPSAHLKVEIAPQSTIFQPGEEVVSEVRVHDGNGAAVPDAEVTFFAVDDGVLALTGYERPQPLAIFGAPFPLAIRTGLTLFDLLPEDPGDLEFANKGYLIGGGGSGGPGTKLRRDFPGTACWFPSLRTNAEGRLAVHFKAPDALTRYRLVAVAHAGGNRFGSGESAVAIRKKLMILSALGQGANVGDEIIARAVLRNESGVSGDAEITLDLDATAEPAQTPLTEKFRLKNGEARTVDFPVRLRAMGDASWKWSAHLTADLFSFHDAVAATMKIGSSVPVLHETYLSELSSGSNDLLAGVNPQLLEGSGSVGLTLSNTRLASLREPAKELLEYPYGCAEQTASSLIPWIVFPELGPVLPDLAKNKTEVQKAVRAGVDKLFAMQTANGGIAYWPGGREPQLFTSAYAVLALSLLEKQGQALPAGWPRLLDFVSGELRALEKKRAGSGLDDFALALFALASAGKAEPAYHEQLFDRRAELSLESRALLACAVMEAKGPANLVAKLLDPRAETPECTCWFGSPARERATLLLAWSRFKPGDREVARLVKELLAGRVNGRWRTTQENAWALLALSRYFSAVEREVKPVEGSLVKAGTEVPFALTKSVLTKSMKFAFDPAAPLGSVEVRNARQAPLFGEANFVVRPPVAAQPRQDRGYAVSRSYRKIGKDGALEEVADWQVGERVVVSLRVETSQPGHFVAIDDPLPAVLEALNPDFRTQQVGGARGLDQAWAADYREIRADRVLYFCDHLPAGVFTFRYLARVRAAGKVTAPAAKVEEMYRPERFGLCETMQLTSRPADR